MISVKKVEPAEFGLLIGLIKELLIELGDEASGLDELDEAYIIASLTDERDRHLAYFAVEGKDVLGFFTLSEMFAVYSGGYIGVINEMYTLEAHRSKGIGKLFIDKIKEIASERNWKRLDVTAPTEERWKRTVKFYEKNGFVFTGPKLKLEIPDLH